MRENYLSYGDVVNYFGKTRIADRYKYIYDKMNEYIRARNLEGKLYIHTGILQQVIMDYFVDIFRLKEFHKVDRIDSSRIIAYEAYWILRRKPIQAGPDELDSRLVFSNEGFITTLIAHEFLFPEGDAGFTEEEEEQMLNFLKQLNYHLKYRYVDKQNLELMLLSYRTGKHLHI